MFRLTSVVLVGLIVGSVHADAEIPVARLKQLKQSIAVITASPARVMGPGGMIVDGVSQRTAIIFHQTDDAIYFLTDAPSSSNSFTPPAVPMGFPGGPPGFPGGPMGMLPPGPRGNAEVIVPITFMTRDNQSVEGKAKRVLVKEKAGIAVLRMPRNDHEIESLKVTKTPPLRETMSIFTINHQSPIVSGGIGLGGPPGIGMPGGPGAREPMKLSVRPTFRAGIISSIHKGANGVESIDLELVQPATTGISAVVDAKGQFLGVITPTTPRSPTPTLLTGSQLLDSLSLSAEVITATVTKIQNRKVTIQLEVRLFDPEGRIAKAEWLHVQAARDQVFEPEADGKWAPLRGGIRDPLERKEELASGTIIVDNLRNDRFAWYGQLIVITKTGEEIALEPEIMSPMIKDTP